MTFGDLRFEISKQFPGQDPDVVDGFINDRYREIWNRRTWQARNVDTILQTVAIYQTGTLLATEGSAALIGTGTVWTALMTGRKIRIAGGNEIYTFTRTGATTGTLDRAYEGDTAAEATYEIFQNEYDLPDDVSSVLSLTSTAAPQGLVLWSQARLDREAPSRPSRGCPGIYAFARVGATTAGETLFRVELYSIPDRAYGLPLRYRSRFVRFPTAGTVLPEWIAPAAIKAGVSADLSKGAEAGRFEAKYEREVNTMHTEENARTPVRPLRIAQAHTRNAYLRSTRRGNFNLP